MKTILYSFPLAAFLILNTAVGQSTTESVLSLERVFHKPYIAGTRPLDPKISPDGQMILFRWDSSAHNKYRYWLMHSNGSNLREIADTVMRQLEWSPDSRHLACTRDGDVFLTDTSFQSFERITKTKASEGGLTWSIDGKFLAFSSEGNLMAVSIDQPGIFEIARQPSKESSVSLIDITPDSRKAIIAQYDREGLPEFIVPRFTTKDVTTQSVRGGVSKAKVGIAPIADTGAIKWITLPGDERFFLGSVVVSPDGKNVLIDRFSPDRKKRQIFAASIDSAKAQLVYEESDKAWVESGLARTRWSYDGKWVLTTSERNGWNHLYRMKPDGKELRRLTSGEWEIRWFDVHPSENRAFLLTNRDDHHQWQLFSLDLSTEVLTRISTREGTYESPVVSDDGSLIVAKYSHFAQPADLVRIQTTTPASPPIASSGLPATNGFGSSEIQLTFSASTEFGTVRWTIPEVIRFKSRDGKSIPALLYKPPAFDPIRKYPLVVFVHGAGYLQNVFRGWSYYYREYMFHHRLAQRGYVVLDIDYRGSAGYGRDFRADVYMHLGGKDLTDELDGLEYLKRFGYIDSTRVGIYGGSYGGFMALMGLFLTDAYACGAALRAVTSWENYYRHNSWYTEARLGKPEDNVEAYAKSSPITFADSLKNPLLILHGMVDDNVFFQDAVQLIAKLQKAGKRFEAMMYPDEGHGFTEPETWYDEYLRIEEFFDRHLMSRSE